MEPVAAAYYYESTLDHDELILIGDFGGGTSDFSLLRVGPDAARARPDAGRSARQQRRRPGRRCLRRQDRPQAGLARAGRGLRARSLNKILPACRTGSTPSCERWHYLSFLRTSSVMNMLKSAGDGVGTRKDRGADSPDREDLGYQLITPCNR